jgi:hypothetical protein
MNIGNGRGGEREISDLERNYMEGMERDGER